LLHQLHLREHEGRETRAAGGHARRTAPGPIADILHAAHEFSARVQRGTKPSAKCAGT